MDTPAAVAVLGSLASILGLFVATLQGIRLRDLRRRTNADVWLSLRTARAMIRKLETGDARKQHSQVAEAYGKLTELFCHLLKQAVLDEKEFTEETIRRWREAGKLDSDWQEAQARQFLATSAIHGPPERKGSTGKPSTTQAPNPGVAPVD